VATRWRYIPEDTPPRVLFLFLGVGWDWVHLVRRPLIGLLSQPRMIDDECEAVGGMRIGRGNRSTRRRAAPVPLCLPQIPHDLPWARTWGAAVGIRRLTAWAIARPTLHVTLCLKAHASVYTECGNQPDCSNRSRNNELPWSSSLPCVESFVLLWGRAMTHQLTRGCTRDWGRTRVWQLYMFM
jgi:hypothetical protein